jgi:hypothetical protein
MSKKLDLNTYLSKYANTSDLKRKQPTEISQQP